ncbi:MAG: hypothetical protein K9K66_19070 [Desulfarculaceae bacterium]|nr:hypothetical protein [Desulfarculaceae bacterium]MCF8073605.1 hypothetical protein [Desulfarculaceae bacterium]MCF8103762.1 hypothetical protein [Desulfarculaceae bacterium]MCF8115679.1 hypothetical protein [Desulfarculaceae bacterium]
MKAIKLAVPALLLGAMLCLPALARAYTVYNQVAYQACVIDAADPECCCAFTVPANGKFNAWDSAPLVVWFNYNTKPGVCYLSEQAVTMTATGSAKMYSDKVQVYDAKGKLLKTVGMRLQTCGKRTPASIK